MHTGFWVGDLREGDHLGYLGIDGSIIKNIKMDLQYARWGGMDWIPLAQDRDRWQAVVKVIMNLGFQ